jgi:hypothetical protein
MNVFWRRKYPPPLKCYAKDFRVCDRIFFHLTAVCVFDEAKLTYGLVISIVRLAEFRSYFEHVRSLRFEDRPDYDYLKRLFRELFFRKGFSYDNMFDWELLSMQKQRVRETDDAGAEDPEGGTARGLDDGAEGDDIPVGLSTGVLEGEGGERTRGADDGEDGPDCFPVRAPSRALSTES